MLKFKNITPTNGFDVNDLNNAMQNNYAWSCAELGEYIYIGTGRNVPLTIMQSLAPGLKTPNIITPIMQNNIPEIWRYKKDGSMPWEKVFTAPSNSGLTGFRYMVSYTPNGGSPCLVVAGYGKKVQIYKTSNGVNWTYMNSSAQLMGTSSRAMVIIKDVLYLATVNDAMTEAIPYLYKSRDPEFYAFENIIDVNNPLFDPKKNPNGAISNMIYANNRLYLGISTKDGCEVWRSNGEIPQLNEWTLIVDKGFGDSANKYTLSMGAYHGYVYVGATKKLPLAWALPLGCDIIRIDRNDNWELVVGGHPLVPSKPTKGERERSISGYGPGFNNPFNVYAWQIQEYRGRLVISTFDDSSNMEVILDTLLANKAAIEGEIGLVATETIIGIYMAIIRVLKAIKYPYGFDLYESYDGRHFYPNFKNGLGYPGNYGGRILFVDSSNKLYLGTANPFQGCQVWKARCEEEYPCVMRNSMNGNHQITKSIFDGKDMDDLREEIVKNFKLLNDNLPIIMKFIPKELYEKFI